MQLAELQLVRETLDCGRIVLGYNSINRVRGAATLDIAGGNGRAASNTKSDKRVSAMDFVNKNAVNIERTVVTIGRT